jgi:hypothetical protein
MRQRLLGAAKVDEDQGQVRAVARIVRSQLNRLVEMLGGFFEVPQLAQGDAEIAMRSGKARAKLQGAVKLRDRFPVPSQTLESQSQVVVGLREVRPQAQGRTATVGCQFELSLRAVGLGEVDVVFRNLRLQVHRSPD